MATVHGSTRREFLTAGGVAGAALLAACSRPREPGPDAAALVRCHPHARPHGTEAPHRQHRVGVRGRHRECGARRRPTYVHTSGSYADQNHERMLSRVFRGRPRESFLVGSSPNFPEYRFEGGGHSLISYQSDAPPSRRSARASCSASASRTSTCTSWRPSTIRQPCCTSVHEGLRGAEARRQDQVRRHRDAPQRAGGAQGGGEERRAGTWC